MTDGTAIRISSLSHSYGTHQALAGLTLNVPAGSIFGLLGPNGGGKSTLFHLLSTILPIQQGQVTLGGFDLRSQADEVRRQIGVTFQSPSLDARLTVAENLRHHGHLYGLSGRVLRERQELLLERFRLTGRTHDRVESLSGGMKRRVEVAKGLLHQPQVLLLDEPSTGLDPGARHDLWEILRDLRSTSGMTLMLTTHLMDEAEHCDSIGILDQGQLVACDRPEQLKSRLSGDTVTIRSTDPQRLRQWIMERTGIEPTVTDETLKFQSEASSMLPQQLLSEVRDLVLSVTIGQPSLEDVFLQVTGRQFASVEESS